MHSFWHVLRLVAELPNVQRRAHTLSIATEPHPPAQTLAGRVVVYSIASVRRAHVRDVCSELPQLLQVLHHSIKVLQSCHLGGIEVCSRCQPGFPPTQAGAAAEFVCAVLLLHVGPVQHAFLAAQKVRGQCGNLGRCNCCSNGRLLNLSPPFVLVMLGPPDLSVVRLPLRGALLQELHVNFHRDRLRGGGGYNASPHLWDNGALLEISI
mmetsp:Transcript_16666/g.22973  ORF Transcript_16666/g.22973 Transcript_16666/m.22973 type:complete len:209 (-) Transcript_16666:185-811(-)